jgi:site-specific DNA recombinase
MMMDGKLDSGKYNELYTRCSFEIESLQEQKMGMITSNQEAISNFKSAISVHASLTEIYNIADTREKKEIIGSIFPKKLIYDKNGYRTTDTSGLAHHIFQDINQLNGNKKKKEVISDLLSTNAPPPGLEPGTP